MPFEDSRAFDSKHFRACSGFRRSSRITDSLTGVQSDERLLASAEATKRILPEKCSPDQPDS